MEKKIYKRLALLTVLFSILLNCVVSNVVIAEEKPQTHILILNSCDSECENSMDITKGVKAKLKSKNFNTDIETVYMDCRRNAPTSAYFQLLYDLYKFKYENRKIDLIFSYDKEAFDFLTKYSKSLFPHTPIVFCGVKSYSDSHDYNSCTILGGKLEKSDNKGKVISEIGNKILSGTKPTDIKVKEEDSSKYLFNSDQLESFKISEKGLPKGSEIINKPTKKYYISRKNIVSCIIITLFFILILFKVFLFNKLKRIKVERDLRKSEELLRTLINASPDVICFKDGNGKWLEANVSMHKLFKVGLFDYKGKYNLDISRKTPEWNEDLYEFEKSDEEAWKMATILREEKVFKAINEEQKVYDVIKVPIFRTDGSRNGLVVLGRDITERTKVSELKKNAEESKKILNELREYDKVKTEFFANISHELRTPLNVILGALQLIELIQKKGEMLKKEESIISYTNVMKQNCFRLVRLVNNLIDITKIDAGFFHLELHNYDIVYVVENITLSVKDYVESKGIRLIFDTNIEEKKMAFDPDKIERILLNLLSNAIKFTSKDGIIMVTVEDKGENIIISVKDTGIGISEDKHKAIFERFIQVDKSLSRNREGSGIGLSLVKSLVELHNGRISLKSEINKGSEFIIELPVTLLPNEDIISDTDQLKEINIEKINIEFSDIYS